MWREQTFPYTQTSKLSQKLVRKEQTNRAKTDNDFTDKITVEHLTHFQPSSYA